MQSGKEAQTMELPRMTIERDKRIYDIVVDYENRDTLEYSRGTAYNIN